MIVFSPTDHSQATNLDLGSLSDFRSSRLWNLGVHFDESIKLDKHLSSVIGSSFHQLRLLSKIKHVLNVKTLEMAVHAFITSRLDYCNSLYCGIAKSQITRLQLVQNASARFLHNSRKCDHIFPILRALHWLPIKFLIDFKVLLLVYKSLHHQAHRNLSALLHVYTPTRSLRSSDQNLLLVPQSRLKCRGDRAFSVVGPRLWNNLPLEISLAPSPSILKSLLKIHLFDLAY